MTVKNVLYWTLFLSDRKNNLQNDTHALSENGKKETVSACSHAESGNQEPKSTLFLATDAVVDPHNHLKPLRMQKTSLRDDSLPL